MWRTCSTAERAATRCSTAKEQRRDVQFFWTGFDDAKFCDIFLYFKDTRTTFDMWRFYNSTQRMIFFPDCCHDNFWYISWKIDSKIQIVCWIPPRASLGQYPSCRHYISWSNYNYLKRKKQPCSARMVEHGHVSRKVEWLDDALE